MNHIKSDLENFQHTNGENDREPILDTTRLLEPKYCVAIRCILSTELWKNEKKTSCKMFTKYIE